MLKDIKERRLARYVATYCAAGWAVLQVLDQVVGQGIVPEPVYRVALTLFLCAMPGAFILSWFHGARGRQRMPSLERWMLAGVGAFALSASAVVAGLGRPSGAEAGVALEAIDDPRRVAVLYFDTRGGEDAEFLAAGLTEALIDELGSVDELQVVSRNGSALYRESPAAPDSIGRALEVGLLVTGTVAQAGDRVRITADMVEARGGEQLHAIRIERPREELFDLQDDLAREVALFLREKIGEEIGDIEVRGGTDVLEAWELVQRAEQASVDAGRLVAADDLHGAETRLQEADGLLARAEAADPAWPHPVVRRGWMAYQQSRLGGMDRGHYERWIATGLGHAERALALAPSDPDALELQATLLYWRHLLNLDPDHSAETSAFHRAEEGFRAALAADPGRGSAWASLSHLLLNKGEVAEAKLAAVRAYESDPYLQNANLTLWRLFQSSWDLADAVEARRWCGEGVRRFPADFRFHQCRLMLYALKGQEPDLADAEAQMEAFTGGSPPQVREINRRRGAMYLSMALVRANLPDSARAVAIGARASGELDPLRELALLESIPRVWMGDIEEAVRLLGLYMAANANAAEGYRNSLLQGTLPWYHQGLADDPRFRSLVGAP